MERSLAGYLSSGVPWRRQYCLGLAFYLTVVLLDCLLDHCRGYLVDWEISPAFVPPSQSSSRRDDGMLPQFQASFYKNPDNASVPRCHWRRIQSHPFR